MTSPMQKNPLDWTLAEAIQRLNNLEISSVELTRLAFERIKAQQELNAFLALSEEQALAEALQIDERRRQGERLLLGGVPVGLKDIILTKGVTTTCASKILEHFVPPYDATVVERLRAQGGISVGKMNMDEFAMGSSNENSAFGAVRNPWDTTRTPGGSSGGSAAAVASRAIFASLGTDTGGSIREPASFTGIVGIKPTYGRVSRYGVAAFASSLDQVGVFARTAYDTALMLEAIAGYDAHDSTSAHRPFESMTANIEGGLRGLKIGIPKEYFVGGMDPDVEIAVQRAIREYERIGARLVEVSLPHTHYAIAAYYVLCTAEAASNLERYDGARYGLSTGREEGLAQMYAQTRAAGFGREVKRRIILGTFVLSSGYYDDFYIKAQKIRTLLCQDFANAFANCDLLLTPTTPFTAFQLGEKFENPLQMYLADVFTVSCNLAGIPGLSLPCGFDYHELPIGLQLLGPHFSEPLLLRAAHAYEREHQWHLRHPLGF